jgi:hypothetical protein
MSSAVLQINVIPICMLTMAEAARHCGRSLTQFKIECPVNPVTYQNGDKRYDVQDLDVWIDSLTHLIRQRSAERLASVV